MPGDTLYDTDFYAWATRQAALLRAGDLAAADIDPIADTHSGQNKQAP
jgi:hypothetical protein